MESFKFQTLCSALFGKNVDYISVIKIHLWVSLLSDHVYSYQLDAHALTVYVDHVDERHLEQKMNLEN